MGYREIWLLANRQRSAIGPVITGGGSDLQTIYCGPIYHLVWYFLVLAIIPFHTTLSANWKAVRRGKVAIVLSVIPTATVIKFHISYNTFSQVRLSLGRRILATDGRSRPISSPWENICFSISPVAMMCMSFRKIKVKGKSCNRMVLDKELRLFEGIISKQMPCKAVFCAK